MSFFKLDVDEGRRRSSMFTRMSGLGSVMAAVRMIGRSRTSFGCEPETQKPGDTKIESEPTYE